MVQSWLKVQRLASDQATTCLLVVRNQKLLLSLKMHFQIKRSGKLGGAFEPRKIYGFNPLLDWHLVLEAKQWPPDDRQQQQQQVQDTHSSNSS